MDCVAVRLGRAPKLLLCGYPGDPPPPGSWVVVTRGRGQELGQVRSGPRTGAPKGEILRPAAPRDLERHERQAKRAEELFWWLKARLRQQGLKVKLVNLELSLDGGYLWVGYSSEERVDLRRWVGELARLAGAKVEFVPLGPREQAGQIGTLGACGMESCCSSWLGEFVQVGIRMARDQQLPLSPEKISGPCGRLLCCLQYEHAQYQELLADLPKRNSRVCTREGVWGKVVKLHPLSGSVELLTEEGGHLTVSREELLPRGAGQIDASSGLVAEEPPDQGTGQTDRPDDQAEEDVLLDREVLGEVDGDDIESDGDEAD
jgi:cell fate regulator YaaT (PSP1 superfamily)